uniref:Glycoside hydrolase/deacetylase, beta/alpha-barrel-like protein n=1 Tax=Halisarca dujardinii TaxID=2583056 RepID=A0AA96S0E1_HALDU|nr:glycoside hydrolase/deacetylase, beta/alpha-barrel-like protein [Halisarca dujardinii]
MVTISFDDAIRVQDYERFYTKILQGRTNPNGCKVPLTFFVSHYDTDYSLAAEIVSEGHELAVHSVTHRTPSGYWAGDDNNTNELTHEILDMRSILSQWARVPKDRVVGYRTPFLASSEDQLKILHENDFLYDCTMVTNDMYWPFTLDYKSPICNSPAVCPDSSLPGLWVIPNINKVQNSSFSCSMIDSCSHPFKTSYDHWTYFFRHNFERHYNNTKVPFGLYAHASWFYYPSMVDRLQAFIDFLDYLGSLNDVYIVTMSQLIAWSKNPTPLSQISTFKPWGCTEEPPQTDCVHTDQTLCKYSGNTNPGSDALPTDIFIRLCGSDECPTLYPNVTVPAGEYPVPSSSSVDLLTTVDLLTSTELLQPSSSSSSSSLDFTSSNSDFATSSSMKSSSVSESSSALESAETDMVISQSTSTQSDDSATADLERTATTVVLSTRNVVNVGTEPTETATVLPSASVDGGNTGPGVVDNTARGGASSSAGGGLQGGAVAGVIVGVLLVVGALATVAVVGGIVVYSRARRGRRPAAKRRAQSGAASASSSSYRNPSAQLTL